MRLPNVGLTVGFYLQNMWRTEIARRSFAIRLVVLGFGCCWVAFYGMLLGVYVWRGCCGWGCGDERVDEEVDVGEEKDAGLVEDGRATEEG